MTTPRRPPRFDVRWSAEVQIDGRSVTGTTRNLSTGGVCIEIDRPVAEGSLFALTLFMVEDGVEAVGGKALELKGTVQWVAEADHGYAVGFRFASLSATQLAALGQAITTLGE